MYNLLEQKREIERAYCFAPNRSDDKRRLCREHARVCQQIQQQRGRGYV